jgi:ankyrin repeat protein
MLATIINNCPIITMLLKHRANINEINSKGLTALMIAVTHKHTDAIQCLLDAPTMIMTINKQNNSGETALMMAILLGNKLIIQQLLNANADTEIANNKGLTPLQVAQKTGDQEIIDLIQNAIDKKHKKEIIWSKK